LLFVSNRDGGRDIYLANLNQDGSVAAIPTRLTTGLEPFSISLAADGRRLVYTVFSESSNIWRLPIPTESPVSVAQAEPLTGGTQLIEGFDVSPDGRWLAFNLDRTGDHDIFRTPIGSGEMQRLTSGPQNDFGPVWSPDGREIAFHAFHNGTRQIFVISASGTDRVQVTRGPDDHRSPKWLASGQGLVFTRNYNRGNADLRVVHRDRHGRWGVPRTILRADLLHVAVAPRGDGLAFTSGRGLNLGTTAGDSSWLLVSDGHGASQLRPSYVSWSRDGREIYYLALDPDDRASIWVVARRGGSPRLLVRFDDPTRPWHRFGFRAHGRHLYFTLGDRQSDVWSMETMFPQ
jgi:Tol biopolymer transport system component